tara:strand:- start:1121 stop:2011 length:891 start_codon:yes stop_codon:yes gene_type:complete
MKNHRLCLGTAKIGDPTYGFSTSKQQSDYIKFLKKCYKHGIDSFDTSPRYDDSEEKLGYFFSKETLDPFVSTKIDNLKQNNKNTPKEMLESINKSRERLNIDVIDLCYLHQNAIEIISDEYVQEGIFSLKDMGLIKESGTSIYSMEELEYTIESGIYEWIQVPLNILDISFYNRIISYNLPIKIAARSIFLQGIMFDKLNIRRFIPNSEEMINDIERITEIASEYDKDFKELSVQYLFNLDKISMIIFGSTSIENINFIQKCQSQKLPNELLMKISNISSEPKQWTNPRGWLKKYE